MPHALTLSRLSTHSARFSLFLVFASCFWGVFPAREASAAHACSPVVVEATGDVTVNNACPLTVTAEQLGALRQAISSGKRRALSGKGALAGNLRKLSGDLAVQTPALVKFFRILSKRRLDTGGLDRALRQIARQHLELSGRIKRKAAARAEDSAIQALLRQAQKSIEDGDYVRADEKLAEAAAQDLSVIARRKAKIGGHMLQAAGIRAERGELALLSFDYIEAGEHFFSAMRVVPADKPLMRARFANRAGVAFHHGRDYGRAEPLYGRALAIGEAKLGPDHPHVATWLNNLAEMYRATGRYTLAESLYKRALAIDDAKPGANHPNAAKWLNNLALLYKTTGRYQEAEPLYKRALAIGEARLGPDHPDVAVRLNNLAVLYRITGRHTEAEPLYKRALAIGEARLGPNHPKIALRLNNLALLYKTAGRYRDAEPLYQRALAIGEAKLGPGHPVVGVRLNNLAALYRAAGRDDEAEPLYKRALAIFEASLGQQHPHTRVVRSNLQGLLSDLKK